MQTDMLTEPNRAGRASWANRSLFAAAGLAGLLAFAGAAAPSAGPFEGLEGLWGGSGTVTYASGTKERLRCRVQYVIAQNIDTLSQALRCASDSYNFQINALYVHQNGTITGNWDEKYLEISGTITGRASAGLISGNLHGPGFLASVVVDTNGNSQTVRIAAEDQEIREVAVVVRKVPQ
jgi:hypothetical protein